MANEFCWIEMCTDKPEAAKSFYGELFGWKYEEMPMDQFIQIISQPFTWGLLLGLFLVAMTWRVMRKDITVLKAENKRISEENKELQTHLNL